MLLRIWDNKKSRHTEMYCFIAAVPAGLYWPLVMKWCIASLQLFKVATNAFECVRGTAGPTYFNCDYASVEALALMCGMSHKGQ